ncbi:Ephrin_rec_like domain-containing protein, partial [Durusdinium trenchii]
MNQSCTGKPSNFHVSLGLHVSNTSQIHMARVQRLKIGGMLEDLGHMGTPSSTGLMISRATVQRALEDDSPLFLDDWRSYDGRYHQPQRFFRRLEDLEGALISCDAWAMEPGEYLTRYAALTGDFEGLRFTVDGVRRSDCMGIG